MKAIYMTCTECRNTVLTEDGETVDFSRLILSTNGTEFIVELEEDKAFLCDVCIDRHDSNFKGEDEE